jgi:E3 ubiquitin-protein ligase HUWE1
MRQEVIAQHFREQGLPMPSSTTGNTIISPDFLDALPDEIREELLRQERLETERVSRAQEASAVALDPSSLLERLNSRQQTLAGIFGAPLSGNVRVSGGAQSLSGRQHAPVDARRAALKAYENRNRKDTAQLLDRTALMNLIRLIFVPDNSSNAIIYQTLVNLSENSKTRTELCLLLLSILADGSRDLASVDKNFAQMTIKAKAKGAQTPRKLSLQSLPGDSSGTLASTESVPNLVAQRCIEALTQLVESNILVVDYLLSESDQLPTKTPTKKGKSKETVTTYNYPVVILLRLLENSYFLENSNLLEQLTGLLTVIFKEFSKAKATHKTPGAETPKDGISTPVEAAATPAQTPHKGSKKVSTPVVEAKVRVLPAHYLKCFVSVLRDGACSSKSFRNTLSVIQNISRVKEYKELIAGELVDSSQHLGELVFEELKVLVATLNQLPPSGEIESKNLSGFSSATAQQAKLLRLLKAIDFIHSEETTTKDVTGDDKSKSESDSKTPSKSSKKEEKKPIESPPVYDKLNLTNVWHQVSLILSAINDKPDMIHIATVLLPLIESFMVVSKPYVLQKKSSMSTSFVKIGMSRQVSALEGSKYDFFVAFTDQHRKILNTMVRNNPSLMGGSFSLLVDNPKVLEFDNKRTFFNQQIHKKTPGETFGSLQINVRRPYVFEDSFHQLQGRSGKEIKLSKLNVRFSDEEGVDAGGVTREWYTVLARQMFNPNYALFRPSAADKVTYQPNRASGINPDHLSFFKFVGRVIGKAIYDGHLLDCYFTRSFYKFMLGIEVDYKDMEAIDPEYHKSLEWILNNDITDVLDLNFVHEVDDFGHQRVVELKPDGKNIPVTEENKHEYVKLIVQQKLVVAIKDQIDAFLTGFHEIIPKELIKIFNEQELELLISGMPEIDIDDW